MRSAALAILAACLSPSGAQFLAIGPALAAPPTLAIGPALAAPPTPGTSGASRPPTSPTPGTSGASHAPISSAASCVDEASPYDAASLRQRVAYLASAALDGRAAGSAGDALARAYITERFRCLGLLPGGTGGSYWQPFRAAGRDTANVVGYLPGSDPAVGRDIILVGAHHDHLGRGHLGANDNASGTAALLAIAQAIRQGGAPHRTIAFVAFGGEELGLRGSAHFAAHPPAALPLDRLVYDINLDMVGSHDSARAVHAMGTFRGLAATPIVHELAANHPALNVRIGGRGAGSDHEAFCRAGVPYVFFWTPDRQCYHQRCDTADRLDAVHLAQIAALAGELVERLSDTAIDLAAARAQRGCTGVARREP